MENNIAVVGTGYWGQNRVRNFAELETLRVFVEKPPSLRTEKGKDLIKIAEERGNILMVGHILLYHPAVLSLQELVNNFSLRFGRFSGTN